MSQHKIVKCKDCGTTIMQCRCPNGQHNVEYSICSQCKQKLLQPPSTKSPIERLLEKSRELREAATPGPWTWESWEDRSVRWHDIMAVGLNNPSRGSSVLRTSYFKEIYLPPCPIAPNGEIIPARHGKKEDAEYVVNVCNSSAAKDQLIQTMHDALTKIAALNCNLFQNRCIPCDAKEALNEVNKIAKGVVE